MYIILHGNLEVFTTLFPLIEMFKCGFMEEALLSGMH